MSGVFGVVVKADNCLNDLFYGTDYHSHLGTRRGGLAVVDYLKKFVRIIHDITNHPFRSKFETDFKKMEGSMGIGVISDFEDQPLVVQSSLGTYAIVTVGKAYNVEELKKELFSKRDLNFIQAVGKEVSLTELAAALISSGKNFAEGIKIAQENIKGSCSLLLLTTESDDSSL